MAKVLTSRAVEQTRADPSKRREIPDGLLTGLYLVIQPGSGAKSWAVRYRYAGRPRKLTLGPYPALELGEARDEAKAKLQIVAKGGDPASQKRKARQETIEGRNLVANVVADFIERHARDKRSRPEVERMLNHDVLPIWGSRQIQDITKRDVIELLDNLQRRGVSTMTNRVFSVVRKLFNWAVARDIVVATPCAGMRAPVVESSRDRVLADDEIRWLWKAAEAVGYPFGPLTKLLLLTLQREGEASGLSAAELKLRDRVWTLPKERAKNGRANEVALSEAALAVINGLPTFDNKRRLLFTTTGEAPVSGYSRAKKNLDREMLAAAQEEATERGLDLSKVEIPHWTFHDLRRTGTTGMQRLGIPPHIADAILNHKSGTISGVAAIYARHSYADEKRSALEAWGRFVTTLVENNPAEDVIAIGREKK